MQVDLVLDPQSTLLSTVTLMSDYGRKISW
jgi:hypothetical protein